MAKRGELLRKHILWSAKDVLLELGFERASMDLVASRAGTTKRSLYAHFENKEDLFLSVIGLVRANFLAKLKAPADYSLDPQAALTAYCGRYLEILLHRGSILLCRNSMSESVRFREQAAQCFELLFAQVQQTLGVYLAETFALAATDAAAAAARLLGQLLYPRFTRALFDVDPLAEHFGEDAVSPDFDLAPVGRAVAEVIRSLDPRAAQKPT